MPRIPRVSARIKPFLSPPVSRCVVRRSPRKSAFRRVRGKGNGTISKAGFGAVRRGHREAHGVHRPGVIGPGCPQPLPLGFRPGRQPGQAVQRRRLPRVHQQRGRDRLRLDRIRVHVTTSSPATVPANVCIKTITPSHRRPARLARGARSGSTHQPVREVPPLGPSRPGNAGLGGGGRAEHLPPPGAGLSSRTRGHTNTSLLTCGPS